MPNKHLQDSINAVEGRRSRPGNFYKPKYPPRTTDIELKPMPTEKKKGLFETFADKAESVDPTGLVKKLRGKPAVEKTTEKDEYNYIPKANDLDDLVTQGMNRQTKVKKTFGKLAK